MIISKEKLKELYWKKNMTYKEIAEYFKLPNGARIQHLMEKYKIPRRNSTKRNQSREKNHMWTGGKILHHGYYLIKFREHPRADNRGYVPEHVLIMEKKIGRFLLPNEIVHHINYNTQDNRIKNLQLLTNSKHAVLHREKELHDKLPIIQNIYNQYVSGKTVKKISEKNNLSLQTIYRYIKYFQLKTSGKYKKLTLHGNKKLK